MSPTEIRPGKDCAGEAQKQLSITDPSSRQRMLPIITNPQLSEDNFKENEKEKLVTGP
jgi:hypothetical protein